MQPSKFSFLMNFVANYPTNSHNYQVLIFQDINTCVHTPPFAYKLF
jgi:hypothetical protein